MKSKVNSNQIRCGCGRLYLVKTRYGYEFKCPRCKRICLLSYEDLLADYINGKKKIAVKIP